MSGADDIDTGELLNSTRAQGMRLGFDTCPASRKYFGGGELSEFAG